MRTSVSIAERMAKQVLRVAVNGLLMAIEERRGVFVGVGGTLGGSGMAPESLPQGPFVGAVREGTTRRRNPPPAPRAGGNADIGRPGRRGRAPSRALGRITSVLLADAASGPGGGGRRVRPATARRACRPPGPAGRAVLEGRALAADRSHPAQLGSGAVSRTAESSGARHNPSPITTSDQFGIAPALTNPQHGASRQKISRPAR